jgi:soluble lytic murein transglycosylase
MKTRYRGDALEFIEEIPYEETRAYVRLVMRNLIFYRLLKSQSASIEFPAWVLKLDPT